MDTVWKLDNIKKLLKPIEILEPTQATFNKVCIDSRQISKNDIFLALKGAFKDGHDFIEDAFENGASLFITEKSINKPFLKVNNSNEALKKLAEFNKNESNAKIISIVGSIGKTTTKELLKSYFNIVNMLFFATNENENNWIGVSKTLLRAKKGMSFGIIEVGTNHRGEIAQIASFLKPDYVIFTEIGSSHIGNFGSIEAIFEEKTSIVKYLKNKDNVIFNKDNDLLKNLFNKNGISYSKKSNDANVFIEDIGQNGFYNKLSISAFSKKIELIAPFSLNTSNILAVISFLESNKLLDNKCLQDAINNITLPNYRMQLEELNNTKFILDCYNASFESVKFAIEELNNKKGKKLAILGDMLELGKYSEEIHTKIGKYLSNFDIDLIGFGDQAKLITQANKNNKSNFFDNKKELLNELKIIYKDYDFILIKGSRGLKMEEIFHGLKEV